MVISALPFPSAVLGRYGNERTAVVLYASSMAVAGGLLTAITLVAQRRGLMTPGTTSEGIRRGLWRGASTSVVFALSIPVAFVAASAAQYMWIALPLLRVIAVVARRRSASRRGA